MSIIIGLLGGIIGGIIGGLIGNIVPNKRTACFLNLVLGNIVMLLILYFNNALK